MTTTSPYMFPCPTGFGTPIPTQLDTALHLSDFISLTSIANWVVKKISGTDLLAEFSEYWAGDFTECVVASQALEQLADFCEWTGEQVMARWVDLDASWNGNAAKEARHYFKELSTTVASYRTTIDEMAQEYKTAAFGVYEGAKAVGDLVATLIDLILVAGLGALATFLTGGLGSLVAGAGTTAAVLKIASTVKQVVEIRGQVLIGIEAVLAVIATGTSAVAQFEDFALPGAYDNSGV